MLSPWKHLGLSLYKGWISKCEIKKEMATPSFVLCSQQLKIIVFSIYLEGYSNKPRLYNCWLQVNGLQVFNTCVSNLSKHFANTTFSSQRYSRGRERYREDCFVPGGHRCCCTGLEQLCTVHLNNHSWVYWLSRKGEWMGGMSMSESGFYQNLTPCVSCDLGLHLTAITLSLYSTFDLTVSIWT